MPGVVVRRIRADEGAVLRVVRLGALAESPSAFGSTYATEAPRSDGEWDERARAGAAGADRVTFFAVDGTDVVGLVGGYRPTPDIVTVELVSMWTSPAARRAGVGRALVAAVVDWAVSTGAEAVGLWVTRGNEPAVALYRSAGFVATGEHQRVSKDTDTDADEDRMTLALAADVIS